MPYGKNSQKPRSRRGPSTVASARIPQTLVERIDKLRGDVSPSDFYRAAIDAFVERHERLRESSTEATSCGGRP